MTPERLQEIENQGYNFIQALIPVLRTTQYADKVWHLWRLCSVHRGGSQRPEERKTPEQWRSYMDGQVWDYAFFAGAETAIREYEAGVSSK